MSARLLHCGPLSLTGPDHLARFLACKGAQSAELTHGRPFNGPTSNGGPMSDNNLALFCDFENVALGVRDEKFPKFDISLILERLLVKGNVVAFDE